VKKAWKLANWSPLELVIKDEETLKIVKAACWGLFLLGVALDIKKNK
jgi:hypothetical protein